MSKQILAAAAALLSTPGIANAQSNRAGLAMDFGPVNVAAGQSLQLCANNLFADSPMVMRFMFLNGATGKVIAYHDITVPVGQGACVSQTAAASEVPGVAAAGATATLIGLLAPAPNTRGGWNTPFSLGPSSAQVVDTSTGKAAVFVPAVQRFNVVLPAVQ